MVLFFFGERQGAGGRRRRREGRHTSTHTTSIQHTQSQRMTHVVLHRLAPGFHSCIVPGREKKKNTTLYIFNICGDVCVCCAVRDEKCTRTRCTTHLLSCGRRVEYPRCWFSLPGCRRRARFERHCAERGREREKWRGREREREKNKVGSEGQEGRLRWKEGQRRWTEEENKLPRLSPHDHHRLAG